MCIFFWQPTYLQFVKPIQYTQFSMYTHITLAVSAVESLVSLRACGAKVLYYSLVFPSIWMKEIQRMTYHFYYYSICTSCFVCLIKPEHNNKISNQWGEFKEKLNKNESGRKCWENWWKKCLRRFKFENKLVAWRAMCDVVHFCLCEKERKGLQWEHFSEADIFSSV